MNKYTLEEVKAQKKNEGYRRSFADYLSHRNLILCDVCGMYYRLGSFTAFDLVVPPPDSDETPALGLACQDCMKNATWVGLFEKQWNLYSRGQPYRDVCLFVIPANRIDQELAKLSDEDKSVLWIAHVRFREPVLYADDVEPIEPLMRVVPFDGDDDPFDAPVWGGGEESRE